MVTVWLGLGTTTTRLGLDTTPAWSGLGTKTTWLHLEKNVCKLKHVTFGFFSFTLDWNSGLWWKCAAPD